MHLATGLMWVPEKRKALEMQLFLVWTGDGEHANVLKTLEEGTCLSDSKWLISMVSSYNHLCNMYSPFLFWYQIPLFVIRVSSVRGVSQLPSLVAAM